MSVPGKTRSAAGKEVCLRRRYNPLSLSPKFTKKEENTSLTPSPHPDYRKLQPRLLTSWPSIPIEVAPIAALSVLTALRALGSPSPEIRLNPLAKSGPLKTDQAFYIIDAPFGEPLQTSADANAAAMDEAQAARDGQTAGAGAKKWTVDELAEQISKITGVLEVGLFCGLDGVQAEAKGLSGRAGAKPVAAYFGMEDGSVEVRHRKGGN
jgi:ribose 5-phosphate isomerase A